MITTGKLNSSVRIDQDTFPHRICFEQQTDAADFIQWYKENTAYLDETLLSRGAILFQGVAIDSVPVFEQVTGSIAVKFRNYIDGSYPRRKLKGHVYVSTEYDPAYNITLHNELSYSVKWPSKLFFGCIIPPEEGGETPLADSRRILQVMDPALLEEFNRKQVRYIRNLHGGEGLGPSWQEVFETEDKKIVEKYCADIEIVYEWKDNGGLRLTHIRPATAVHPVTKEKIWFNQVDQFHPSHFNKEIYETLLLLADYDEEALPLYASFGDGSKISDDIIKEVQQTIDKVVVVRPWEKGDFIIVDNMLAAHGRKAYKGARQIVVSMS